MRLHKFWTLFTLALGAACLSSTASANLTIIPNFDSTITSDGSAAQIMSTINQAIGFYNTHYTDDITVHITFRKGGGLGSSSTTYVGVSYANYLTALTGDASTADDTTALAHLPNQVNDPAAGNSVIAVTRANARALGFSVGTGNDSTITLNTTICNLDHSVVSDPSHYDLYAVACHEIDEALGTSSGIGGDTATSADMFRYDGSGNRSWSTNTASHAWFSIDGTTNIVEYNQFGRSGGDWGDWIHHSPNPQVQDFSGTAGKIIDLGPSETRLLDVVGYNYVAVPEPASMAVLGLGVVALIRRRKKNS